MSQVAVSYTEIILHAGLGKTGSTSIQDNCVFQRELLAQHGLVYPTFTLKERTLRNHSDVLVGAVCKRTASYGLGYRHDVRTPEETDELRANLRAQLLPLIEDPQGEKLVLSAEGVAEFDATDLQLLEEALAPHAERLRVLIYVRSPQSAIESMLQQRVKGGQVRIADDLLGVVRSRYERLAAHFGERLEVANFHTAIEHTHGLVGHFFTWIGVPEEGIEGLDFRSSNERISREAFDVMLAMNQRHPLGGHREGGLRRQHHDLVPLYKLPGEPFQLQGFIDSSLYEAALEESAWLEDALGFEFPPLQKRETGDLWQERTLFALEETIRELRSPTLREAAADGLDEIAGSGSVSAEIAAVMRFVAARVRAVENNRIVENARHLGHDYFKFSALQIEHGSTLMALRLMEIAKALNPDGEQIKQRLKLYRERLEKSRE